MFSLKEISLLAQESDVAAAVDAVDRYLAAESGPQRFRHARGSATDTPDRDGYRGLAGIGVTAALVPEPLGGSGFAPGVAVLLAERLGWSLAREPYVENVVFPGALLLALRADALVRAACGDAIPCVAWQEGGFALPGSGEIRTQVLRRGGGALRLQGQKRFVMGARPSTVLIVLASMMGEPAIVAVDPAAAGVVRRDRLLADGTFWSEFDLDLDVAEDAIVARGADCIAAFRRALALANLALAGMLHGLQSRILQLTLDYLRTRVQFGRPIGAFQALQHRAVDLYTHAQIARLLLGEAVDAMGPDVSMHTLERYASRAKARAADSAMRIAKEGIQMHGAIGFSDEHDLGLYVKRILVASTWLGGAAWHRRRCIALGEERVED